MKRFLYIFILTLFIYAGQSPASARLVLTLNQCLDSAMTLNGNITAAAMEIEKAGILKGTAFDPPKTGITLKQETTGGGGPDNGVSFSQDFEFPTVYVKRSKVLSAQQDVERGNFNIAVNDLSYQVTSTFYTLLYRNELLKLNREAGAMFNQFFNLASTRFADGDCSALEKLNATRMVEKNELERTGLLADYDRESLFLGALTGCGQPVVPADTVLCLSSYTPGMESFNYSTTPAGMLNDSEISLSSHNLTLARHELLPDLYVAATVQALIKGFNPYHIDRNRFQQGNFMGFEVGISVPLFFGAQRSRIKAAEADLSIARLRKETAAMEAETRYGKLLTELDKATATLNYYTTKALPQADEIKRLAEISYEYGEIDYMEYLGNIETYFSIRKDYLDAVNEYNQTIITINSLNPYK